MKKHIWFVLCYFSIQLYAQDLQFFQLNKENHLTSNSSLSICQDSKGYLWIGTSYGLNRFDGNISQHYFKKDGLCSDFISWVYEDSKQQIWIGTDNGVNLWDGIEFQNIPIDYTNSLSKDVQLITELNGDIYLGTKSGLFILKEEGFEPCMVSNTHVLSIDYTSEQFWAGTSDGLYTFNPTNDYSSVDINIKGSVHISTIYESDLVFTDYFLLSQKDTITYPFDAGVKDIEIHNEKIYIGTYGSGLWTYDGVDFKLINSGDNTIDRTIQQLISDTEGDLWVASNAGVTAIQDSPLTSYKEDWSSGVFPIYEYQNTIYYGGNNGIYAQSEQHTKHHSLQDNNRFILCMGVDEKAQLLASGIGGVIYKLEKGSFKPVQTNMPSLNGRFVYDIQANDTATFYATGTELYYSKGNIFKSFNIDTTNGMSYDIHSNDKGLWITTSNGLLYWDGHNTHRYDTENGLPSNNLKVIEEDIYGNLWLGTTSSGLIQYQNDTTKVYNEVLSNPQIKSLEWDNERECLWVGTDNGLNRVNINGAGQVSDIQVYNNETGCPISFCHNKSLSLLGNGDLVFGANIPNTDEDCVYRISGKDTQNDNHNLEVVFTSLSVNDSLVSYPYIFNYQQNNINISYSAIHLTLGNHIQFKWRLNDGAWNEGTPDRNIQFYNLSPSTYSLSVRCKLPYRQWSEPSVLEFQILPPFWKTWWFITLVVLLFCYLIYYYSQQKAKSNLLKQQEDLFHLQKQAELELRAVRSQLNPHFLFNTLNSIQDLLLDKNEEKARIYLSDCAHLMRKVLEYSSESKITLGEEIALLKNYLKLENLRFSENIQTKWEIEVDEEELVPPLILQPYVENAIKHGIHSNGEILISIRQENDVIRCIVQDNGKGYRNEVDNNQSKGLKLMQERLDALNQLENTKVYQQKIQALEKGTQVELHLKKYD